MIAGRWYGSLLAYHPYGTGICYYVFYFLLLVNYNAEQCKHVLALCNTEGTNSSKICLMFVCFIFV